MDIRLSLKDLTNPKDVERLTTVISKLADELDIVYTESSPNGSITARQGRRCLYKNGATYEIWENTDGSTTWQQITTGDPATFAQDDEVVKLSGAQTVADVKTFSSFPITPSAAPTTDYQVANKKYADDTANTKISKTTAAEISAMTEKTSPAAADVVVIEDSAVSYAKKKVQVGNLPVVSQVNDTDAGTVLNNSSQTAFLSVAKTCTSGKTIFLMASGYIDSPNYYVTMNLKHDSTTVHTIKVADDAGVSDPKYIPWTLCAIVTGLSGSVTFSVEGQTDQGASTAYGNLVVMEF